MRDACESVDLRIALVMAALSDPDMDNVVLAWGDRDGKGDPLGKLDDILDTPLGVNVNRHFAFQRLMLPLATLFTTPSFTNSPHTEHKDALYRKLEERIASKMGEVVNCVEQLLAAGYLRDPAAATPGTSTTGVTYHCVQTVDAAVLPIAELLLCLCRKFNNFSVKHMNHMSDWCLRMAEALDLCRSQGAAFRKLNQILELVSENQSFDSKKARVRQLNKDIAHGLAMAPRAAQQPRDWLGALHLHGAPSERPRRLPEDQHPAHGR